MFIVSNQEGNPLAKKAPAKAVKKAKKSAAKAAKKAPPKKVAKEPSAAGPRGSGAEDRKLGEAIRARRLEIGMSQERLAELIGLTFQQVQKYEKGVNRVAWPRLLEILDALDLTFEEFVEKLGLARAGLGEGELAFPANAREVKLAVMFRKASPAVQKQIIAMMEALVNGDH